MVDADRWQRNELIGQLPEVRGIDIELDMPTRNVVNPAGERVQFVDGLGPTAIEIEPDARIPAASRSRISASEVVEGNWVTPTKPGPNRASDSRKYPWSNPWNDPETTAPPRMPSPAVRAR